MCCDYFTFICKCSLCGLICRNKGKERPPSWGFALLGYFGWMNISHRDYVLKMIEASQLVWQQRWRYLLPAEYPVHHHWSSPQLVGIFFTWRRGGCVYGREIYMIKETQQEAAWMVFISHSVILIYSSSSVHPSVGERVGWGLSGFLKHWRSQNPINLPLFLISRWVFTHASSFFCLLVRTNLCKVGGL